MNKTLEDKIADLPGLIAILREDPAEWHDYRIQMPETSLMVTMNIYLCDGKPLRDDVVDAIWRWSIVWVSLGRLQTVMHGNDAKYKQPTPRLRLIAFLEAVWLAIEPTSESEIDRALRDITRL